ncbi:MAG: sulfite exporter TauE/SafE family protein [Chloroflexi bacterium]|nr:sulfite exporter TauE/SafE family protein [Chloroflexota bacterium]
MTIQLGLAVSLLALGGGVVAGLLGISGAVLMVPLLLYAPALLGLEALTVKTVAALAIVQGLFAASAGIVTHGRNGYLDRRIAVIGGAFVGAGALVGGALSRWAPDVLLLAVFAVVATLAVALMMASQRGSGVPEDGFQFHRPWRLGVFLPEGLTAGMVGVGGGFITLPVLHRIFGVPLRVAIASALAMSWFGAFAGFLGKAITGQVPLLLSVAVVLGAAPGAWLGAWISTRLSRHSLRYLFVALLVLIALSLWWQVFTRLWA